MFFRLIILILFIIPGVTAFGNVTNSSDNLSALLAEKNKEIILTAFENGTYMFGEDDIRLHQDQLYKDLATGLAHRGEYSTAADLLLLIPDEERSYDSTLLLAFVYTRMNKYDQALKTVTALRAKYPDDTDLDNAAAYILSISGDPHNARRIMEKLGSQIDENGPFLDTWGTILAAEGEITKAEKALKSAYLLLPHDAEVLSHLADVYAQQGRLADAQDLYQRAVRSDPAYGDAAKKYALVLKDLGRYPEAVHVIRKTIRLMPGDPDLIEWEQEVDAILLAWYKTQEEEAKKPLLTKRVARGNHS